MSDKKQIYIHARTLADVCIHVYLYMLRIHTYIRSQNTEYSYKLVKKKKCNIPLKK